MIFSACFDYVLLAYHAVVQQIASSVYHDLAISHLSLPPRAVFPGPWEGYIKAPANRSYIRPSSIWHVEGPVSGLNAVLDCPDGNQSTTIEPGGLVIFEFSENIAGR